MVCATVLAFPHLREVVKQFGLIPAQAGRLGGLTFATSFFLHAGVLHLVANSYFLLVFGDDVENALGRPLYLLLLAFSAFIGDLAHIAADPRSNLPCIGASGGIAGVIAFYALAFPKARLAFLFWRWWHWIRLPAGVWIVWWIVLQIIGAFEQVAGVTSVSALAHLGGAAVGVVCWLVWRWVKKDAVAGPEDYRVR
jgi:membrane associated rhomboid family serine protease